MKGLKKLRRLFALLMAMIMVMGTCITTQAADTGSITISGSKADSTYSIYKLFDLSYNKTTGSYSYTIASGWESFFATGGAGASYVNKSDNSMEVTWNTSADVEKLAGVALAYAEENDISAVETKTAENQILKFENLDYGYYLVSSSYGAICSLDTVNSDITITEKNGSPTIKKTVEENSTGEYGQINTAGIGDDVSYKTEISNAYGIKTLILHDQMSGGLTLNSDSFKISSGESLNDANTVDSTYYTIITDASSLTDDCTFEIKFASEFTATLTKSDIIYVEYTAKVNSNAVIGSSGNTNYTYVEYGDGGNTSNEYLTTTYVYDLYIYKYDGETEQALEGAEFYLTKTIWEGSVGHVYGAILDENNKIVGWDAVVANMTKLVSAENGLIEVIGLDAGDYALEECKAPDGYAALDGNVEFTITESGELEKDGNTVSDTVEIGGVSYNAIMVANGRGDKMPSTGGIGTTIFYVIGSIMALGAAVVLITRRRMHES